MKPKHKKFLIAVGIVIIYVLIKDLDNILMYE